MHTPSTGKGAILLYILLNSIHLNTSWDFSLLLQSASLKAFSRSKSMQTKGKTDKDDLGMTLVVSTGLSFTAKDKSRS